MVWKIIKRTVTAIFCLGFILCMVAAIYLFWVIKTADPIDVTTVYDDLAQKTIVYDGDGKEMDILAIADGNRTIVKYEDIPEDMVNAIVSIEDKTFWSHHGFNIVRLFGALKNAFLYDSEISGTSTLTQQLARNVFLSDIKSERTLQRKVCEAYYAVQIEKNMTKEEIIEAYLNTVYFGFGSYGIDSAASNYFSKNLKKLDLFECATLAALPQAPDSYALVGIMDEDYKGDDVIAKGDEYKYVNNYEASTKRRNLVLDNMVTYGYISSKEAKKAKKESVADHIKLNSTLINPKRPDYYEDYLIDVVIADLMEQYNMTEGQATNKVYCGGLKIYSCVDLDLQEKVQDQINESSNYTALSNIRYDWNGNIIDNSTGHIMLYDEDNWFDDDGTLVLDEDDFKVKDDGTIIIYKGRLLTFAEREDGFDVGFKRMYRYGDYGELYTLDGGYFVIHDAKAKITKNKNLSISKEYIQSEDSIIKNKDSKLYIKKSNYVRPSKVRQPQAAAVLMENKTAQVKAIVGGRGQHGKFLYNRAVAPHQTGSSIKPLSTYGPALQKSVDYMKDDKTMSLISRNGDSWGRYITAGSIINDAHMTYQGKDWPKNASGGYMGRVTFRKALQQSINTCAVKIWQNVGVDYSLSKLKANGITTYVEKGNTNDLNPAAMALGGQTVGVSPLEMTAAYCTFSNNGVYRSPIFYTKVVDANGKVILEGKSKETRVFDSGVNWIMRDIMETVVTQGIAGNAQVYNMPTYGKTGTTSSQHEIWFCGGTPYYTMALWEGNDTNLELGSMSGPVASFWRHIMTDVHDDLKRKELSDPPSSVVRINGEYYVKGTK